MHLGHLFQAGIALSGLVLGNARIVAIPSIPFDESDGNYSLSNLKSIIVDSEHAEAVDEKGQTLIPPTLHQFAETFQEDIKSTIDVDVALQNGNEAQSNSIFITLAKDDSEFQDVAGRPTHEGYKLDITDKGITITGASPLGAWWGTRSLIQMAVVSGDSSVPQGSGTDAPGWATRGAYLDAGRHYYPPDFLVEFCSYLSFFKQNTFHVHLSDNLVGSYPHDMWMNLYSAFRLWSDDPAIEGLNKRRNESYTRDQFDDVQRQCARRGVTIIPEIEAPGHALVFVQWKPELALDDLSMLNISHPDTIPTMQKVWKTFLPWFHSKTVQIGADEYDKNYIGEYTRFVNTMNEFIRKETDDEKSIRIWGTFTPKQGANVSTEVSYQHWVMYEDKPFQDYIQNGYNVLNTDDAFYMVSKYSTSYPQSLNKTRAFYGNPAGGAYAPNIFDIDHTVNNPPRDNPKVLGHISALWNDFGPNTTTYLEAYYSFRDVLPALADKDWGGDLKEKEYDSIFDKLQAVVPAQNLDRRIKSKSDTILKYDFNEQESSNVKDSSGNGYDGSLHGKCKISNGAVSFSNGCYIQTPLGSKGRNYTLSFSVKPTSPAPGTLFEGPDSTLLSGIGSVKNVTFVSAGNPYTLNYSLPLNTWTDVSVKGQGDHTYFEVSDTNGDSNKMEFLTRIGINGQQLVWERMGIEAPLATIGKGFNGMMKNIELRNG